MKAFVVFCSAVVILLAGEPAVPQSPQAQLDAVEKRKAEVAASLEGASEEVKEAGDVLAQTELAIPDAEDELSDARGKAAAAEVREAEAQREAEKAADELDTAVEVRQDAQDAVDTAREERADILSATYRGVELSTLSSSLEAEELGDLVDRLSYFDLVTASRQDAVEEVTLKRTEASNARNRASLAAQAAEDAADEAERLADLARQKRDAAEDAYNSLVSLKQEQKDALATAEKYRDDFQDRYDKLQRESDALARQIREASEPKQPDPPSQPSAGDGRFLVPVNGWKSSNYGWRTHPMFGTKTYHGGVDFAAGSGSTIYAAGSGTVVYAGWNGGYGLLTCIDHGGGLATCYGHQSDIHVSRGQRVSANAPIGSVGSTGQSTGPHLHFEVRRQGSQVDPVGYLPSCLCR